MTDDEGNQPPAWWVVDRRAARDADRAARREERASRSTERRGRRRGDATRAPMTPEQIADAAIAVIDEHGVEGLTVRALAESLGVGTMTLYWYVRDKGEVLDLVADRLLAGITLPPPGEDWRASVRDGAIAVRAGLLRHARAVPVLVSRGSFGPNGLGLLEASIAVLREAGFGAEDAADAYSTVSNFVTGTCVFEASGVDAFGPVSGDRAAFVDRARRYIALLPPDEFPNVLAAVPRLFGGDRDARFRFGLECLIEGLARRAGTGVGGGGADAGPAGPADATGGAA